MTSLESMLHVKTGRCDYYRRKIAEHSPPASENDHRMIRIYKRFLSRDRTFVQNLKLLKMIEEVRKDVLADVSPMPTDLFKSPASLDVDELRTLLDESQEVHPECMNWD